MARTLFRNVKLLDGSGPPYLGYLLVEGNRIRRVARAATDLPVFGATFYLG